MSIAMYQASVPVFIRALRNISTILEKASAYAENRKIEPEALLQARLAPDMFPLTRQIQIATDTAKGCSARLANIDIPSYEDSERTFADLQSRIAKTITFLEGIDPALTVGSENRTIALKLRTRELTFKGQDYLLQHALPNFFFHVTTAYAIFRHNGLDIGKADYLGSFENQV